MWFCFMGSEGLRYKCGCVMCDDDVKSNLYDIRQRLVLQIALSLGCNLYGALVN